MASYLPHFDECCFELAQRHAGVLLQHTAVVVCLMDRGAVQAGHNTSARVRAHETQPQAPLHALQLVERSLQRCGQLVKGSIVVDPATQ